MAGVSYVAAFGGGVVSFLSPCVLPLVPAYLAMVTGLEVAQVREPSRQHLGRIARDTALFVAGFGTVFVLLGLAATSIGRTLVRNQLVLTRISGLVVLSMALFLVGSLVLRSRWLFAEKRFHPSASRLGPFAAPVIGAAFAFGWTPCIGPVLGSVLVVAANQQALGRGAALLVVYSLGLGVPFMACGLAFGRLTRMLAFARRRATGLNIASAGALACFGVLLTFNRLIWVTTELQAALRGIGFDDLVTLG